MTDDLSFDPQPRTVANPPAECMMPAPLTWHARLLNRLFPWRYQEAPDDENDGGSFAPGYMRTQTVVQLDWKDRLRILFGGVPHFDMVHRTDVYVTRCESRSTFFVRPPRRFR